MHFSEWEVRLRVILPLFNHFLLPLLLSLFSNPNFNSLFKLLCLILCILRYELQIRYHFCCSGPLVSYVTCFAWHMADLFVSSMWFHYINSCAQRRNDCSQQLYLILMQVVPSIAMVETYTRLLLIAPHSLFRSHFSVNFLFLLKVFSCLWIFSFLINKFWTVSMYS